MVQTTTSQGSGNTESNTASQGGDVARSSPPGIQRDARDEPSLLGVSPDATQGSHPSAARIGGDCSVGQIDEDLYSCDLGGLPHSPEIDTEIDFFTQES